MISLPQDPIPGREGSVLHKGGKTPGDSSDREDLANLLRGPFCKYPSCLPKRQPGVPQGVFLPWAPPYNWGASVQAVGAMQEGLLRNAGTVSVLEIAAFRNYGCNCSFSAMKALANGFGRSRCSISQMKERPLAPTYGRDTQTRDEEIWETDRVLRSSSWRNVNTSIKSLADSLLKKLRCLLSPVKALYCFCHLEELLRCFFLKCDIKKSESKARWWLFCLAAKWLS